MKFGKLAGIFAGTSVLLGTAMLGTSVSITAEAATHTYGVSDKKAAVCIGRAEVTMEELQAADYKVPILIKMQPNPGIKTLEFGFISELNHELLSDDFSAEIKALPTAPPDLDVDTWTVGFSSPYNSMYYTWVSWASSENKKYSDYAVVLFTLPSTASPGDEYRIEYLDTGLSGNPHLCQSIDTDYTSENEFEGLDGYIKIVGSPVETEQPKPSKSVVIPDFQGKTLEQYISELEALGIKNYNTEAVVNFKFNDNIVVELNRQVGESYNLDDPEALLIYYVQNPVITTPAPLTTTTTTQTTTTTTTTTTATVPTPASKTTFTEGINNWSFANSAKNFGESHYISDSYLKTLLNGLNRAEQQAIMDTLGEEWGGSCYGMATTSILSCYNQNFPAQYQSGATFLHDIVGPPTKETLSLINYYFALQVTDYVYQNTTHALYNSTEKEKITKLLDELKDGSPTLLTYFFPYGGHAVVAYDVERGKFVKKGKTYNVKIVTYDNNAVDYDDNFCMYINTSNNSWLIPAYYDYGCSTENGATLGITTNDLDIINYHGYLNGKTGAALDEFIPILNSKRINSDYSLRRINLNKTGWTINAGSDDDIVSFSSFTDDFTASDIKFAIKGTKRGCAMQLEQKEDIDMSMRYPNDLLQVSFANADTVVFDPSGYAEVAGDTSKYNLEFISNDGHAPTDWYQMEVSGKAGSIKFYKAENGYILNADSLQNVTVSAMSDNASPSRTFSTDKSEVFIYEIDENTIGVSIDKDGDGTFETPVEPTGGMPGDVDNSGTVDILDVIAVNKFVIGVKELDSAQQITADVNRDGDVNTTDSLLILKYALDMISSFS